MREQEQLEVYREELSKARALLPPDPVAEAAAALKLEKQAEKRAMREERKLKKGRENKKKKHKKERRENSVAGGSGKKLVASHGHGISVVPGGGPFGVKADCAACMGAQKKHTCGRQREDLVAEDLTTLERAFRSCFCAVLCCFYTVFVLFYAVFMLFLCSK